MLAFCGTDFDGFVVPTLFETAKDGKTSDPGGVNPICHIATSMNGSIWQSKFLSARVQCVEGNRSWVVIGRWIPFQSAVFSGERST